MVDKFSVSILTPDHVFDQREVTMAVIPGAEGEMGILAHHIDIITRINGGLLTLYDGKKIVRSAFIYSGFAEFEHNKLYILADSIREISELDTNDAQSKIKELTDKLLLSSDYEYNIQLISEIKVYQKIIDIIHNNVRLN